jgi:uncharacterized protein YfaS (alpha-2-macroglobulin family)
MQAYRLYTLALAGSPELGAMNRLREMGNLPSTAAWMLASAYAKAGQPEAAKKLVANLSSVVKPYRELGYTYGSDLRDKALILETLSLLNERTKGFELLKEISASLSNQNSWMSTQEVAYCLKAVAAFAGTEKRGELKFSYTINNGKNITASTQLPIAQVLVPIDGVQKGSVKIVNESAGVLYVRLVLEGTPARGQEEDAACVHLERRGGCAEAQDHLGVVQRRWVLRLRQRRQHPQSQHQPHGQSGGRHAGQHGDAGNDVQRL